MDVVHFLGNFKIITLLLEIGLVSELFSVSNMSQPMNKIQYNIHVTNRQRTRI
jgi:hypothetical protein